MRYYKQTDNGYIVTIGTGGGGTEIHEEEYNAILAVIRSRPAKDGYDYRLREDLTWEEYEAAPDEDMDDGDIDPYEVLAILTGEVTA